MTTVTTSEPLSRTVPVEEIAAPPGWRPDPYFKGSVRFSEGRQLVGRARPVGGSTENEVADPAWLIDAAIGTAAGLRTMPRLGTAGDRGERSAGRRRHRWTGLILLALLVAAIAVLVPRSGPNPDAAPASSPNAPASSPNAPASSPNAPAFPHDAPDPDVLLVGSTYYAYTTGTSWGNYVGVLRSSSPTSGWTRAATNPHGSSALPSPPPWQELNTQNAPGVVAADGRFLMYYDAVDRNPPYQGLHCLSVATASDPAGPFVDTSTGPLFCDPDGSIDPSPYVAPGGQPWLTWKSNDGASAQSAVIWSARLDAEWTGLSGSPQPLLAQNLTEYPWETTVEAPDLVTVNGVVYLFFSAGIWGSTDYSEHFAVCPGAAGPCAMTNPDPVLSSGGQILGPGSASTFRDAAGNWFMAYDAWSAGCTSYSCGGARKLYVSPLTFAVSSPS
jgi:hypothetical protein